METGRNIPSGKNGLKCHVWCINTFVNINVAIGPRVLIKTCHNPPEKEINFLCA